MDRQFTSMASSGAPSSLGRKRRRPTFRKVLDYCIEHPEVVIPFLFGAYCTYFAYDSFQLAEKAKTLVPVSVEIRKAERTRSVHKGDVELKFDKATYHYVYNGKPYIGHRVYLKAPLFEDDKLFMKVRSCAKKQTTCEAYVDPQNPVLSVLSREISKSDFYIFGVFGILLTAVLPWALLRRKPEEPADETVDDRPKFGGYMPPLKND